MNCPIIVRNFYSHIPIDLYCCLIVNKPDYLSNNKRLSFYFQTDCPAIYYMAGFPLVPAGYGRSNNIKSYIGISLLILFIYFFQPAIFS